MADARPTGREDRVIFWCPHCKRQEEPVPWPLQAYGVGARQCQHCGALGVRFVAYEAGVEDALAKRVILYASGE